METSGWVFMNSSARSRMVPEAAPVPPILIVAARLPEGNAKQNTIAMKPYRIRVIVKHFGIGKAP